MSQQIVSHYPQRHGVTIRMGAPYQDMILPNGDVIDLNSLSYHQSRDITVKMIQFMFPGTDYGARHFSKRTRLKGSTSRV